MSAWTTRRLLAWMNEAFAARGVEAPRLSAELLLAKVVKTDRLRLYIDADRPAAPAELAELRALAARALKHEPVQYLVGEGWFFGLPFTVDSRVLIPRPSTETLVEHVLQEARRRGLAGADALEPTLIADVCTGSGCIAIALAKNLPRARVHATDISAEALEVARANAQRHGLEGRIDFRQGDLLAPLHADASPIGYDFIVSNPPYIPDHEWADVPPNVKDYEPQSALRAGPDGLRFVGALLQGAAPLLRPNGTLAIELAASTADAAAALACAADLQGVEVLKDLEGLPRVLIARRESREP